MNEEIRRFGNDGRLAALITLPPVNGSLRANKPVILFITAGLVHKPGPHRLYVQLARSLASNGYTCVRFDLSGIGESSPNSGEADAEQAAVNDVRDVMDELAEETGRNEFVLMGLCSGAEVSHRTAVADARVQGMIALDGYIQRNWKYYAWHYLPRIFSLRKWRSFLARRIDRIRNRPSDPVRDEEQEALEFWRGPGPSITQLQEEFQTLAKRGVRQLQIFSGGSGDCSYANQFNDVFRAVDFRGTLTVRFIRKADHMYILNGDRRNLIRTVSRWLQRNFHTEPETDKSVAHAAAFSGQPVAMAATSRSGNPAGVAGRRHCE